MRNLKSTFSRISIVLISWVLLVSFGNSSSENEMVNIEKGLTEKIASGKNIYAKTCFVCHQSNGMGIPNAFPPLAKSDYLNDDVNRAISTVLFGKTGEITVNGSKYNSVMTPQNLTDEEVADVLTYVYNSWENNKTNVTTSAVKEVKKGH